MRRIQFLIEMAKKGKLELVEPSGNISLSYLTKSESHLESAKILLNSGKLEESVSMSYYAMYHCLVALLFKCGIKSENHAVSIILLKELLKENELAKIISFGKEERVDKQYYTDFKIAKSDAEDMIKKTEEFAINCRLLIRSLNADRIKEVRKELEASLSDETENI